jgi:hypothetical protein
VAASTRPTPNSPEQGRLGFGDRGLDAALDLCDALLQLAHVGHELGGQLPASDRRCAGDSDLTEQCGAAVGGEIASGAAGDQVHQQPMEPVDCLGAGGHQVLAPLGQQVQHHRLVLHANLP